LSLNNQIEAGFDPQENGPLRDLRVQKISREGREDFGPSAALGDIGWGFCARRLDIEIEIG
jgi:hypothetical protein